MKDTLTYNEIKDKEGKLIETYHKDSKGLVQGLYTIYTDNEDVLEETYYKDGKKEGIEKTYYKGDLYKETNYANGLKQGTAFTYDEDGNIASQVNYVNDKREGEGITYQANGLKTIDIYVDDELNGISRTYNKEGGLSVEEPFKNGLTEGNQIYYFTNAEKGKEVIYSITPYVEGERHGLQEEFFNNGNLSQTTNYSKGLRDGIQHCYTRDGYLEETINYSKGEKHGEYKMYHDTGLVRIVGQHEQGDRVGAFYKYDRHGDLFATEMFNDRNELLTHTEYFKKDKNSNDTPEVSLIINYLNSMEEGPKLKYVKNDGIVTLSEKTEYHKGQIQDITTYDKNENKTSVKYYDNNKILLDVTFKDNLKDISTNYTYFDNAVCKKTQKHTNNDKYDIQNIQIDVEEQNKIVFDSKNHSQEELSYITKLIFISDDVLNVKELKKLEKNQTNTDSISSKSKNTTKL